MLLCLTASHHNASFDLLEKLSIGAPGAAATLVASGDFVSGAVVLATCNRFEAYLDIDEPLTAASAVAVQRVVEVVSAASGVSPAVLRGSVTVVTGHDVAEHLFAVSSGLESVILGEDEISGQVRRALENARAAGTTSSSLERLFQQASRTSRGIKSRTAVGGAGRSLVRLGLELASSRVADWADARVLLVGTGQYAATTLAALRDRGATNVAVYSASKRGGPFALSHSVKLEESLEQALASADVVITCTSAETPVIVPGIMRPGRRRIVIDLGLPRNVDPAVAGIEGVELLDLETISLHAPLEELNAATEARAMVDEAVSEYAAVAAEQAMAPAVVALRRHVFQILESEIERARARGDDGQAESALRHLAGVLLHTPSVRARELARSGNAAEFTAALDALFGISVPNGARLSEAVARDFRDDDLRDLRA
ncbi:MAG: glutamyl-tRNA reductase [Microbacteriaceae bacterium]|nr:glutamyl-tRNA reductase [Microbacteriaceae bacterium]